MKKVAPLKCQYWLKLLRRFRVRQEKWNLTKSFRDARKLDILRRRLHTLNRKWNLGVASVILSTWLQLNPSSEANGQAFPSVFDVSGLSTDDGSKGFRINGVNAGGQSGFSVSGAGDINGDGFDDFVIGAPRESPNGSVSGEVYVVFGGNDIFYSELELSDLESGDGSDGFVLKGEAFYDYAGISVAGAGDINGDGIDDLVIGARYADDNNDSDSGAAYVLFGNNEGFSNTIELSTLANGDGSSGFVLYGGAEERSGESVCGIGDINGDGLDDIAIGAIYGSPNEAYHAGVTYVVFGKNEFDGSFDLPSLLSGDGSLGFVVNGIAEEDFSGFSIGGSGDVNGDGLDDVIIGARSADENGRDDSGSTYVIFGKEENTSSSFDLSSLASGDGSAGFVVFGSVANDKAGKAVSSAGDVNGDGFDDVLIGAYRAQRGSNYNTGEAYVILGSSTGISSTIDLSDLASGDGSDGFVIAGVAGGDFLGYSVDGVGDVNDDGLDDVLIGAYRSSPESLSLAGEAYVVYGSQSSNFSSINLADFAEGDGALGFVIRGSLEGDYLGCSVSGVGDVNGDGISDFLIGARQSDPDGKSSSGSSYLIYGVGQSTTILGNLHRKSSVKVFPIPAKGRLEFTGILNANEAIFYSLEGSQVMSSKIVGSSVNVDILGKGIYLMILKNVEKEVIYRTKVLID